MKNLKILSIASIAAMATMAFAASSASATALYNGSTKLGSGSVIDFSIPSGKSSVLVDTGGFELDSCSTSTIKGKLSSAATGSIEEFTWGSCTFPTTTVSLGKFEVVWTTGTEGTVKADAEITMAINTVFFGKCIYGINAGETIGTLTTASSGAATLDVNAVTSIHSGSNFACQSTGKWTATYTGTEPANLRVEAS